jgi:hypothetical protein
MDDKVKIYRPTDDAWYYGVVHGLTVYGNGDVTYKVSIFEKGVQKDINLEASEWKTTMTRWKDWTTEETCMQYCDAQMTEYVDVTIREISSLKGQMVYNVYVNESKGSFGIRNVPPKFLRQRRTCTTTI